MDEIVQELGRYSAVLARSLDATTYANDRTVYRNHLASAARWLGMIHDRASLSELLEAVRAEQRQFGWGYLSGEPGKAACGAFESFVAFLESREV
jgi:hypothetical protein